MQITRNASAPATKGEVPDNFTGTVRIENMVKAAAPSRVGTALLSFAPGARTNWHTHPAGQTLIVTAGKGWVQEEGGERETVQPGDTVLFPASVRHWHGATLDNGMTHIAITETVDGETVRWLEPVSDSQYSS